MIWINTDIRPNPDYLLNQVKKDENESIRGKLKIFYGYAAGVGKSYAMLMEAHDMKKIGKDIVIGYIEPHARPETMALVDEIENIEPKITNYKGITLSQFDLDKALLRKPEIILVLQFRCMHSEISNILLCESKTHLLDIRIFGEKIQENQAQTRQESAF